MRSTILQDYPLAISPEIAEQRMRYKYLQLGGEER